MYRGEEETDELFIALCHFRVHIVRKARDGSERETDEKTLSEILITGHKTMAENSFEILD